MQFIRGLLTPGLRVSPTQSFLQCQAQRPSLISIFCKSPLSSFPLLTSFISPKPTLAPLIVPSRGRTKPRKLHKSMFGGGDNGGVDYGVQIMDMHRKGPHKKIRPNKNPLGPGIPYARGVVIKPVIKKPKKPNSANRKCVVVRIGSGRELTAYVPGVGHNLQEHNVVLIHPRRLQDVPGVKTKCIRGKYDLPHVVKKPQ